MSGFTKISIPDSLRRTIEDIKEIAGKHSDEDVYAMLKDCNMDPNETAQKLLYLDTFHEVKRKRDRRKVAVNNKAHEEYQRVPGKQRQGPRDNTGGRQLNARRGNGYNNTAGITSRYVPVRRKENSDVLAATSSKDPGGSSSLFNGSSSHELSSQLAERNIRDVIQDAKADDGNKSIKFPSLRTILVKQHPAVYPGPTPTPTPTNTSTVATGARIQGGNLKSRSSNLENGLDSPSVSGLYSSASDPVLVPSLNPRNPGTVGIIKRESGNLRNTAEISINGLTENRMSAAQKVANRQAVSGSVDMTSKMPSVDFQGVERNELAESSCLPSSTGHSIAAAKSNHETSQASGPLREVLSEAARIAQAASAQSLCTPGDPSSKQATSEVDIKLHKHHISAGQSVIFPNHLRVPEVFKSVLTFGSLDTTLGQNNEDFNPKDLSVPSNVEADKESSLTHESSSPTSGDSDYPDRPMSPSHVLVNVTPSQENTSSNTALRYDQSKQEMLQAVGGSHNPLIPTMPDYSQSLVTPVVGSHHVQLEGLESQGNSLTPSTGTTPFVTQARGIAQSSIAVSPQMFPFLRQPYPPPNYIPYSPYFSQLYMPPQNAHHLLSPSGFPQQPSAGNIYMPPPSASGIKFPIPPVYKPGNVAGSLIHPGLSSSYGTYGASGVSYNSGSALPPGTSASNDDIAGSELKEKNIYSTIKQNEDMHAMASAPGRDISALQSNVFYNLPPQGQPVAYSPTQVGHSSYPGIYHPTQSMSAPSLVQSLQQQSQAIGGTVEPPIVPPPLSSYHHHQPQLHQPQSQFLPVPQPQYGQMNWNQKLMNRENI